MKIKLGDIFIGDFPITQYFGKNPQMYAKYGLKGHNGVDWGTPLGTQIVAAHDGKVVRVQDDKNGYGIHVRLWNKEGKYATIYGHFQKAVVVVGEKVVAGQLLGLANSTGYSTGHHLHFAYCRTDENGVRLNQNNGYGGWLNPLDGRSVEWDIKNLTEPAVSSPSNGKGIYTEEEMTKMRLERDKNFNLFKEEQTRREGLEAQVKDLNERIGNLERWQGELINSLANQLQCGADESEIKGKIEEFLSLDDRLTQAEKQKEELQKLVDELTKKNYKLEEDLTNKTQQCGICSQELLGCEKAIKGLENGNKELNEKNIDLEIKIVELEKVQPISKVKFRVLVDEIWKRIWRK